LKIAPRDIAAVLRAPSPDLRAILVYGPDGGLVRERARTLIVAAAGSVDDPFRVGELTPAELKAEPGRLADEAAALAFTGGRRAVRVRDADESCAAALEFLLQGTAGDSLVVLEGGDLAARSALRKIAEAAPQAAALPCYRDDERALPGVIAETLRAAGLNAAPDAMAYLVGRLGGDRMVTRRELDKIVLYMGAGPDGKTAPRRVELADAQACVGDTAEITLDDLVYDLGDGALSGLDRALERSLLEGANPVMVLRAAMRHLQRLHLVAGMLAEGASIEAAMKRLRPAPFWKLAPRFRKQAQAWPPAGLAWAQRRLLEAERACKRTGAPAEQICGEALFAIGRAARQAERRRA
jgi:DNA polymerase-3 subunit delta